MSSLCVMAWPWKWRGKHTMAWKKCLKFHFIKHHHHTYRSNKTWLAKHKTFNNPHSCKCLSFQFSSFLILKEIVYISPPWWIFQVNDKSFRKFSLWIWWPHYFQNFIVSQLCGLQNIITFWHSLFIFNNIYHPYTTCIIFQLVTTKPEEFTTAVYLWLICITHINSAVGMSRGSVLCLKIASSLVSL